MWREWLLFVRAWPWYNIRKESATLLRDAAIARRKLARRMMDACGGWSRSGSRSRRKMAGESLKKKIGCVGKEEKTGEGGNLARVRF